MYSRSIEDYLKAIYRLQNQRDQVETLALAKEMGVAAPSATRMIQRLANMGLVHYQPYIGVALTASGQKIALQAIRRHRLLECFLIEKLGLSWEQAHAEADVLEHVISEDLADRMETQLGYPITDPYGSPIPDRHGVIVASATTRLSDLQPGQTALIAEVSDHDPALLSYLSSLELFPGAEIRLIAIEPFGGSLIVQVGQIERPVGREAAYHIFVTENKADTAPQAPNHKQTEGQRFEWKKPLNKTMMAKLRVAVE